MFQVHRIYQLCSAFPDMILSLPNLLCSVQQQGYCFGFVEFHSLSSMNSAIQVYPLLTNTQFSKIFYFHALVFRCCGVISFHLFTSAVIKLKHNCFPLLAILPNRVRYIHHQHICYDSFLSTFICILCRAVA
jgi:hypothetical protein